MLAIRQHFGITNSYLRNYTNFKRLGIIFGNVLCGIVFFPVKIAGNSPENKISAKVLKGAKIRGNPCVRGNHNDKR